MNNFDTIIGHQEIIQHFQNAIRLNKLSHAYIIHGDKGMGKKTLAKTFAKTLQCEQKSIKPCDVCSSCRLFESRNHPDIFFITSSNNKSIGVDLIRKQLNQDIYIKPYKYSYKIYIIEEAEKLTEQAQNAMLKTIEEPPEYAVIFLLTTNINVFLQTILSRCVILNLKPVQNEKVILYLKENLQLSEEQVDLYATFAKGNIGNAKEIATSELFNQMLEHVINMLRELYKMNSYQVIEKAKEIEAYKTSINDYLDIMLNWYRDILVVKATGQNIGIIFKQYQNFILKQAQLLPYNKIDRVIKLIVSTKRQLNYNVNFQLTIESLLLKIKEK